MSNDKLSATGANIDDARAVADFRVKLWADILNERGNQIVAHGAHPDYPHGCEPKHAERLAKLCRTRNDEQENWTDLHLEELWEGLAEPDTHEGRANRYHEFVQAMSLLMQHLELDFLKDRT